MVQTGVHGVLDDFLVELVDAALYGLHQSAATHDDVEVHRDALAQEFLGDLLFAVVVFVHDEGIATELLVGVVEGGMHEQLLIVKHSYLGGNHPRIDCKYLHSIVKYLTGYPKFGSKLIKKTIRAKKKVLFLCQFKFFY